MIMTVSVVAVLLLCRFCSFCVAFAVVCAAAFGPPSVKLPTP